MPIKSTNEPYYVVSQFNNATNSAMVDAILESARNTTCTADWFDVEYATRHTPNEEMIKCLVQKEFREYFNHLIRKLKEYKYINNDVNEEELLSLM